MAHGEGGWYEQARHAHAPAACMSRWQRACSNHSAQYALTSAHASACAQHFLLLGMSDRAKMPTYILMRGPCVQTRHHLRDSDVALKGALFRELQF
mmetsp:Transcript_43494/g.114648  ORF Transcript_43494/g.114648 Transcript_43494/m.114648 type:complete len:96 (+) Transcript_43494:1475-1762(+)